MWLAWKKHWDAGAADRAAAAADEQAASAEDIDTAKMSADSASSRSWEQEF